MKNKIILLCVILYASLVSGCASGYPEEQPDPITPTGYWYFTDNGERVWRTITPGNVRPQVKPAEKNYSSSFGGGSGR